MQINNFKKKLPFIEKQIFKFFTLKRYLAMLTSVDQDTYNNTPQPSPVPMQSVQPSVFTRSSVTMPTAVQTPMMGPNTSIPQVPLSYAPQYSVPPSPQYQPSMQYQPQPQYQTDMSYQPQYKTDQENQPVDQFVNTVEREARGFFNWLFRF